MALLTLALVTGCGQPATGQPPLTRQIVTGDGQVRALEERPTTEAPGIDEGTARAHAAEHVPSAARTATVEARFVALTMASDREIWNFQARPVWLVTYRDVPFVAESCACQGGPQPANTAVALDGRTGALVLVYGSDG